MYNYRYDPCWSLFSIVFAIFLMHQGRHDLYKGWYVPTHVLVMSLDINHNNNDKLFLLHNHPVSNKNDT